MRDSKEYRTWTAMRSRCASDRRYAGRGITVCDRWKRFDNFIKDMGLAPSEGHSIDRIDPSVGYKPSNCRWADKFEQGKTRSSNVRITAFGRTKILQEWARETGISHAVISARLKRGWTPESAVSVGAGKKRASEGTSMFVTSLSLPQEITTRGKGLAKERGLSFSSLISRLLQRELKEAA